MRVRDPDATTPPHRSPSGNWRRTSQPTLGGGLLAQAPDPECPVERALGAIEGRWTTLIVRELLDGPCRFGELRTRLPQLSAKVLTDRLRTLAERGVVERTALGGSPPAVIYALTENGRRLDTVLHALWDWGAGD